MFLWTRRMQFQQPCREFFAQSPKNFTRSPKKNIDFPKSSKPKYSSGHVECSFNYPAEKFSLKVRKFQIFRSKSDKIYKFIIFFPRKRSSGKIECSRIILYFFKKTLFPKCLSGQIEYKFYNPAEISVNFRYF